jgi:cation transport ATPase
MRAVVPPISVIAAAAMSFSSVSVIRNALRLRRAKV